MQQGDLRYTRADLKNIKSWINFNPKTNSQKELKNLQSGITIIIGKF